MSFLAYVFLVHNLIHTYIRTYVAFRAETICLFVILHIATSNIAIYYTIAILVCNFIKKLKQATKLQNLNAIKLEQCRVR